MTRPDDDLDARRAVLEARWGAATEARVYDNPGCSAEVMKWTNRRRTGGVTLYASIGAPVTDAGSGHVDEFMLGLHPDPPMAGWLLAALAGLRAQGQGRISHGSVVSFDEPLWTGSTVTTVLVLYSYNDDDRNRPMPDGRHLSLLSVLPILEHEIPVIHDLGPDTLLERWEAADADFTNPYRTEPRWVPQPRQNPERFN